MVTKWLSVVYVLYLFWNLTVFLKILVVLVPIFSFPFYEPVFCFVLRLVRDLGGRRFRAGGEEVFHCEFAWFSTCMSVRVWAFLVIADPVTFDGPVVFGFFLVK